MERRVVIFLVLSLAVILGYDLLLKQLGLLPPQDTVQEPPPEVTATRSEDAETAPAKPAAKASGTTTAAGPQGPSPSLSEQIQPLERAIGNAQPIHVDDRPREPGCLEKRRDRGRLDSRVNMRRRAAHDLVGGAHRCAELRQGVATGHCADEQTAGL